MKTSAEERIIMYLEGSMSAEERERFENELRSDESLRASLDDYTTTYQLIEEAGRLELKDRLVEIEKELAGDQKRVKVIPLWAKRTLQVAAVAVVAFGLFQLFGPPRSLTADAAFSEYFQGYNSPGVLRDSDTEEANHWEKAIQLYDNAEYDAAAQEFEQAESSVPSYLASFYAGISYLSQEEPEASKALSAFEEVLLSENDYKEQAQWFKALSLIKLERTEEARVILEAIVSGDTYNSKLAEELLDKKLKD